MRLSDSVHNGHFVWYRKRPRRLSPLIAQLETELDENWGKRSAKVKRLKAAVRHYLLALDSGDAEKLAIEEERLRRYSGYNGWPRANPVSRNTGERDSVDS